MATRALYYFLALLAVLILAFVYLRYIEKRTIFYPGLEIEYLPSEANLPFEEVIFTTKDGLELSAWFIPAEDARFTLLFAHGNAGNISHRMEKIKFFHDLRLNVLIFDYRGYGKSQGKPSEKGLYLDIRAAYDYLSSRKIAAQQLIGYGESIGGAVVIELAAQKPLGALIIDSTFSSAKDMTKLVYPFIPPWVFASRFDCLDKVKSIRIPKLFIHSINDEIVPYKLGRKLFENAAPPKEFLQIHGGHNSNFFESESILKEKITDFLRRL